MKFNSILKNLLSIFAIISILTLSGCMALFQAAVFPYQCKKCIVTQGGTEVYEVEGCGASNVRIEEQAKIAAFDLSRGCRLGTYTVTCTYWKQEPIEP